MRNLIALVLVASGLAAAPALGQVLQAHDPAGLPTDLVPNDESSSGTPGSFFDLTPNTSIEITAFGAFSNAANSGSNGDPYTIAIYTKIGSYVGSETSSGDWTLLQSFSGSDADADTPEMLTLSTPLAIAAGQTRGFAVFGTSGGLRWFDDCGGDFSYSDGTLTLDVHNNRGADNLFAAPDICKSFAGSVSYGPASARAGCGVN